MFAVVVQSISHVWLFMTPQTAACQAPLSSTISRSLLRYKSIELVMLSNHLIPCCPFSFRLQSFPASESFPMRQLFASGGQSIGASASASVLLATFEGWFPLGLTGLISLQSKGLSRVFPNTTVQKHQFFGVQPSLWSNSPIRKWLLEKPQLWLYRPFVSKVMALLFNTLFRLVIAFLPRSKYHLISWLQSPSAVILEPKKIKSVTVSTVSPSICHKVMGPDAMILIFWMLRLSQLFFTLLFHFHQEAF